LSHRLPHNWVSLPFYILLPPFVTLTCTFFQHIVLLFTCHDTVVISVQLSTLPMASFMSLASCSLRWSQCEAQALQCHRHPTTICRMHAGMEWMNAYHRGHPRRVEHKGSIHQAAFRDGLGGDGYKGSHWSKVW
jgi:hypothetical protein